MDRDDLIAVARGEPSVAEAALVERPENYEVVLVLRGRRVLKVLWRRRVSDEVRQRVYEALRPYLPVNLLLEVR